MRHRLASWIAGLAGVALIAAPAAARAGDAAAAQAKPDTSQPAGGAAEHKEGEYGGVRPGDVDGEKRPRAGTLSWIGFSAADGVARLFLQSTGAVTYEQRVEGPRLIVRLDGVKHLGKHVRRPLDTRFFDGPVARVSVKKVSARRARKGKPARKAGIEVTILFKQASDAREAQARTAHEDDGYDYLYLELASAGPAAGGGAADTPE
ncbi:MAG: hypothetical protein H6709_12435 [Kofleriaceae bacterium]|nr:hypothetical protein [Kofleriaceae bacterium]MCB9572885.1 hypothetical protein [Kofleriaceae bacterium]